MKSSDPLREAMIDQQLRARGIRSERILETIGRIPREQFVLPADSERAYEDHPLSIGYEQTISQPYIVAYMTELIEPRASDRILEVGTGSGYQTSILASLCKEVYSLECIPDLMSRAQACLASLGFQNIHFKQCDGSAGWPEYAPFDKIIVTAAPGEIPPNLIEQLIEGGRMVIPVGRSLEQQRLILGVKRYGIFKAVDKIPVRFVPMVRFR